MATLSSFSSANRLSNISTVPTLIRRNEKSDSPRPQVDDGQTTDQNNDLLTTNNTADRNTGGIDRLVDEQSSFNAFSDLGTTGKLSSKEVKGTQDASKVPADQLSPPTEKPLYDAKTALDKQYKAIDELISSFNEVKERVGKYIDEQIPPLTDQILGSANKSSSATNSQSIATTEEALNRIRSSSKPITPTNQVTNTTSNSGLDVVL